VAVIRGEPIGFAVFIPVEGDVDILRLGVKPCHRRQGIGTRLLDYIQDFAKEQKSLRMTMTIAEIFCDPGHPDDVSVWLSAYGFRTEPPLIKEYAYMYGQWVDGFRFVYRLGEKNGSIV
jgi:GNAT superfamily N-acetyltransferase